MIKFVYAIVVGCVIFMSLFMWAVFGFSLFWQIQNSVLASPYTIRVYTRDGETIDSVKVILQEEE